MADDNATDRPARQNGLLKNQAETERLATIGKFTAKIAHELNNPLDGILRYINLAGRSVEANNQDKLNEYLSNSRQGIMRMVKVVRELLEFSRCHYLPTEEALPLEHIIEDALKTSKSDVSNVKVETRFASDTPKYPAGNLFQVFCNLIKNAIDSMPNGGKLKISTAVDVNENTIIEFHDTGCGFNPADAEMIFEPFFTTKTRGKGTGLGLAICRDLVARHGGSVTAANHPDGGSIFTVRLPKPNRPENKQEQV